MTYIVSGWQLNSTNSTQLDGSKPEVVLFKKLLSPIVVRGSVSAASFVRHFGF